MYVLHVHQQAFVVDVLQHALQALDSDTTALQAITTPASLTAAALSRLYPVETEKHDQDDSSATTAATATDANTADAVTDGDALAKVTALLSAKGVTLE